MRKSILYISIAAVFLFLTACEDFLEVKPLDMVSASELFADENGVKTVLATIYNKIPMEDFNYEPNYSFNFHGKSSPSENSDGGWSITGYTDHAMLDSHGGAQPGTKLTNYWDYLGIRQVNQFLETIASLEMEENLYNQLKSEAHFVRAYQYFALARRYGGVPIITDVQDMVQGGDNSALFIPRSTEKETWDFILSECDLAIANLPVAVNSQDGVYRATKWAAYALKSRVALHAASVAKYWNNAPLTGDAVDAKLVGGMTLTDANNYYLQCINSSKEIIDNSGKSLFKPNPANREEAAKNFQTMFESPSTASVEIIFSKGYIDGSSTGQQGHCTDYWFQPQQTKIQQIYMAARYGVTLDLVDIFEDYTDDGSGQSVPVRTRIDGVENDFETNPLTFDVSKPYILYDNQYDIFADKDARLIASVILPGSIFKGTLINMQGGMIQSNGTQTVFTESSAVGLDGKTYYTYGSKSPSGFSAFGSMGTANANYSSTGFALRKFLQENKSVSFSTWGSTQAWIDFRLAEIYLNYAEATIESGQGDAALARAYLNALRLRAAHTDQIPATLGNILKERQVELAFEGQRYWDLIRRREYHTRFSSTKRNSLVPILDLRENPPKYLFLRSTNYYDENVGGRTFNERSYYLEIPGVATNLLTQNPGY